MLSSISSHKSMASSRMEESDRWPREVNESSHGEGSYAGSLCMSPCSVACRQGDDDDDRIMREIRDMGSTLVLVVVTGSSLESGDGGVAEEQLKGVVVFMVK